jgi:biopolymer transport protein ExbB
MRISRLFFPAVIAAALWTVSLQAEGLEKALDAAAADYQKSAATAAAELGRARGRIAAEKVPLVEEIRASENRIMMAESETTRAETAGENTQGQQQKLLQEIDAFRKTTTYVSTLAHDGLKAAAESLGPGEEQWAGEEIRNLQTELDSNAGSKAAPALDTMEFLLGHIERTIGGYRAEGVATVDASNQVVKGTYAYVGPETFFRPAQGGAPGTVRSREGAKFPVSYALPNWNEPEAARFFSGQPGSMVADASSGKALRLKETTGTVWQHIRKGGIVAFAILAVGLLAAVMILQKMGDVSRLGLDAPENVQPVLDLVARGALAEAQTAAKNLRRSLRELFLVGLREINLPKAMLEEQLEAVLLEQRMYYERRLPLLAVIATAAPLMGLLGTVVGMVKTFALITVFGTGNAAKLSTGISEVLVATELGLIVAIPTLIAHGFLAHRIHKSLSQLERYALKFVMAAETAKSRPASSKKEPVPA